MNREVHVRFCESLGVRFPRATRLVIGFESRSEARACLEELRTRFAKFGLELHEGKTRLIEFGRYASERREQRGEGRPKTFDFLGFTHKCGKTRKHGWFTIHRHSMGKRMRATLQAIKAKLRKRMHRPLGAGGPLVAPRRPRMAELSRHPWQQQPDRSFRGRNNSSVASRHSSPQPARSQLDVEANAPSGAKAPSSSPHHPSLSQPTVSRPTQGRSRMS